MSERVQCSCGQIVGRRGLARHEQGQAHQAQINARTLEADGWVCVNIPVRYVNLIRDAGFRVRSELTWFFTCNRTGASMLEEQKWVRQWIVDLLLQSERQLSAAGVGPKKRQTELRELLRIWRENNRDPKAIRKEMK